MIFLTETEFISSVLGKNYVTKLAKFSFIRLRIHLFNVPVISIIRPSFDNNNSDILSLLDSMIHAQPDSED